MNSLETYTNHIEYLVKEVTHLGLDTHRLEKPGIINGLLDGAVSNELRYLIPLEKRRANGAFFTGTKLAKLALNGLLHDEKNVYSDPACGIGDLLIECSYRLPVLPELTSTLRLWGKHLIGQDINPRFIRITKARLVLVALSRLASHETIDELSLDELFPQIQTGDSLQSTNAFVSATHVLLNPPYGDSQAYSGCKWASGKVSKAALFMELCLNASPIGTKYYAILPDVLRTGSRYERWRDWMSRNTIIESIEPFGQFDTWTDVDVFHTRLTKVNDSEHISGNTVWPQYQSTTTTSTVGDFFDVHVGAVVPHRDPISGKCHPYIYAHNLPVWVTINNIQDKRHYSGTTFKPPFVVIRRTSRPGDSSRAVATIIADAEDVAVENHLLVLLPKDKTLDRCVQLLGILRLHQTTVWLDNRIRCRHLTCPSIKELPWWT